MIDYAIITKNPIETENPNVFLSKNCPSDVVLMIQVDIDHGSIMQENNGVMLETKTGNGNLYGIFVDRMPIIVRVYKKARVPNQCN
jgi:hypothetical protein